MSVARVMGALGKITELDQEALNLRISEVQPALAEVAPTFNRVYGSSKRQGLRLAQAYATSLSEIRQHRELFQAVALRPEEQRRTLLAGYRKAGQERWVVHALSELPAAQSRVMMRDFVLKEDGKKDKAAIKSVLEWLADMGSQIKTRPINDDTDSAVVEWIEDAVDAIGEAVQSVVDAIVDAVESIGEALEAAVNFTVEQLKNLGKALILAGKTVLDIVQGALQWGYDFVRNMINVMI